jgi:hypothetical protein
MIFNEWLIISVVFVILFIAYEAGVYLGEKNAKIKPEGHSGRVSNIQAGLMGLLGVMLAFSFSLSSQRFEERRKLVIQESLNIGTAYFRAGLLNDTLRNEVRALMRTYLDKRIEFYKSGNTEEEMRRIQMEAEDLQVQIWFKTATIGRTAPNLNTNINIFSLNSMIDISGSIASNFLNHVPKFVLLLLVFITTCTLFIMGYSDGIAMQKNIYFSIVLNLVICFILLLMIDMDRPTTGFLKADIDSLTSLRDEIQRYTNE